MVNQEVKPFDAAQLAIQARTAYEQKRTRECLALSKVLAQVDPGNAEAEALQAQIQAAIKRDLDDARGLLEHSGGESERKKYRKAAELILIKALNLDPENKEAKALLQGAKAVPALSNLPSPVRAAEEIPFTAAMTYGDAKEDKKSRLKVPVALIAIAVPIIGLALFIASRPKSANVLAAPASRTETAKQSDFSPRAPEQPRVIPAAVAEASTAEPKSATQIPVVKTPPVTVTSTATPVPAPTPTPPVPTRTNVAGALGVLAISSAVPADIYLGDKYLGSTPTTVQLPVGLQTLEYRHGDLRTVASHEIKNNETTRASVTFLMNLQINAKPWAQVFLEGSPRRALGQTPLSGVSVPIGGVLVFENPNFPSKSYRITDKDAAIQVNFP